MILENVQGGHGIKAFWIHWYIDTKYISVQILVFVFSIFYLHINTYILFRVK